TQYSKVPRRNQAAIASVSATATRYLGVQGTFNRKRAPAWGPSLRSGSALLWTFRPCPLQPSLRSGSALLDFFDGLGDDGVQVADDAVVSQFEDGGFGVFVDRDDGFAGL